MPVPLPDTMVAAVYTAPGELRIQDVPVPPVGPGEVLVQVSHCGICGSDLHMVLDGWGLPGSIEGHETSGYVAAVGQGVSGWKVGDAVVVGPSPRCGECPPCLAGRPSLCRRRSNPGEGDATDGAFAGYQRVTESVLLAVPAGLSMRHAALAEPLAVALHGITLSQVRPGERVLVSGAGPIGILSVAALRAMGVDDVGVVEPHVGRRELAAAVGATATLAPDDLVEPASPADTVADPYDVVLECSGHAAAIEIGLAQLGPAGRLVIVGAGIKRPRLDNNRVLLNELVVTGSFVYDADGFERALALLASDALPNDLLVEADDVPLTDMLVAMKGLAAGDLAAKVLVVPR